MEGLEVIENSEEKTFVEEKFPFVSEIDEKTELALLKIMRNFSCESSHSIADNSSMKSSYYLYYDSGSLVAVTIMEDDLFFPTKVYKQELLDELILEDLLQKTDALGINLGPVQMNPSPKKRPGRRALSL
jgi:hypothetical protein